MPTRKPSSAGAFLAMARVYADTANALLAADAIPAPLAASPIYFLHSHAAELAFKAFLTAKNMPFGAITTQKVRHNLPELHKLSCGLADNQ